MSHADGAMPTLQSYDMHTDRWLAPHLLFDGLTLREGMAIRTRTGRIVDIAADTCAGKSGLPLLRVDGALCPGFFDMQVNGGAGKMFNIDPSADTLVHIGDALRAAGTTAWLPTFITDLPERMSQAADAILQTIGCHGVVGVHLEGPHISQERRGAHKAEWVRPIDEKTYAVLQRLRENDVPTLLTLAPECQPPGTISRLCAMGVTVSIGHSAANAKQVHAALAEGARCFTHLFNGMTPMGSREPGVVGSALDSEAWCGLIADGHHVSDATIRIAIRARPRPDRMVLVSDAMATTHGPDQFDLYGENIRLVKGKLVNDKGSLAGAHIDLAQCVHRVIRHVGVPAQQVLPMVGRYPAELMGVTRGVGHIRIGDRAELVLLDENWNFRQVLSNGIFGKSNR